MQLRSPRDLLTKKPLARVLEGFCSPFPGFYLYYASGAQMAPKLKAFVDFFEYQPRATPKARTPAK